VSRVGPYESDRHAYIIPDMIDLDVARTQANKHYKERNQTSTLHFHRHGESCTDVRHDRIPAIG